MSQEVKINWLTWIILLGAITVAFVLSNKNSNEIINKSLLDVAELKTSNSICIDKSCHINKPKNHTQLKRITKSILQLKAETDSTLFLFGEVNEKNSEAISQKIISLNETTVNKPILLIIDSPGGAVFPGSKIISAIESSNRPVYTICYGLCASMAAMIHQYGEKRYMVNRSVLMFHNAAGGLQGEVNKMLSQLNFINNFCNKMDMYIANRSGIEFKDFVGLVNSEIWIDAEDSLDKHFSDQTVSVNLENVSKETLLPFTNREHKKTLNIETLSNRLEIK